MGVSCASSVTVFLLTTTVIIGLVCWTSASLAITTTTSTRQSATTNKSPDDTLSRRDNLSLVERKALHAYQQQQPQPQQPQLSRELHQFHQDFLTSHPDYASQMITTHLNQMPSLAKKDDAAKADDASSSSSSSCQIMSLLLTQNDTAQHIHSSFDSPSDIAFGSLQGGTIPLRSTNNNVDSIIGSYTFLNTFLGPVRDLQTFQVDCYGAGTYTFDINHDEGDDHQHKTNNNNNSNNNNTTTVPSSSSTSSSSISFVASCENLPYLTIIGGQGIYHGASGYVHYRIPDPLQRGWLHELHVCGVYDDWSKN